ncbi:MAG: trigger factor [Ruminococcaceae bacterium]|nr:trigger factor [Oscillospiraceae bacterium]
MSLKNVTKTEKNVVEIEFSIDKKLFDEEVSRVYKKNVARMNVPGFRKGKAPRSIIEKMYGKGVFYDDAINNLLPEAYSEAVKESNEIVVSQPEFEVVSIDDNGVVLKAKVYVKPEVEIEGYKGIEVEKTVRKATAEDINKEIEAARQRNSRMIDITDRAAQNGDNVIIDYEGFADGVAFEGGKGEKHDLKLGSGQFIPGFEDQIVGHNIGDAFDVNVKFPEEYHADSLAGKEAVFKVVLHEIKFNELPELNDEFAKDVSEFDTLDEYKADVKAKIQSRYEKEAENHVEEQLIDALIEKLQADIPEAMVETEAENLLRDYDNNLRMQGMNLADFVKYTGMSLDTMREQFKPRAERQVKTRLALEKIAELENIEVSENEIEEEFNRIAAMYSIDVEEVKKSIESENLKKDLAVQKAVDLVKAEAVVAKAKKTTTKKTAAKKEEEATAEEKPAAKKTTTKKTTTTTAKKTTTTTKKTAAKKAEDKAE